MKSVADMYFRRKFSITMRKNKHLKLGEMTFFDDFVNSTKGNQYPTLNSCGNFSENISLGRYSFHSQEETAFVSRFLGRYFPYASYEITLQSLEGACGLVFSLPDCTAEIVFSLKGGMVMAEFEKEAISTDEIFSPGMSLIITCRRNNFDIYTKKDGYAKFVRTVSCDGFENAAYYNVFSKGTVALTLKGRGATLSKAEFYMDCGIAQADIRPIRYENGEIMLEGGKVFLTMSIRMQEECYQGVFSWVPGTAEFELVGALFFDTGDGLWGNDVASSMLYNRKDKMWYLWVCSFSHHHILAHAKFFADVRFGLNVLDVTLLDKITVDIDHTLFGGSEGDEDPDFIYDEETDTWYMIICRVLNGSYKYHLFSSSDPMGGYKYITNSTEGNETGGSILKTDEGFQLVCGSDMDKTAMYHIYSLPDMTKFRSISCDFNDGGYRGWGTVIPVPYGNRTRNFWLTFDRQGGSSYTWSYGNIYCFEAE